MNKKENDKLGYGIAGVSLTTLGGLLFIMPYFGIVFSIVGLVFGAMTKQQVLKTLSIVFGVLGIIVNLVMLIIVLVVLAMAG